MIKGMYSLASRVVGWVSSRPGAVFMLADEQRLAAQPPERFARAWLGLAVGSVVWGIVLANVWGVSWKVFRDPDFLIMPAAVTLALYCLWPFKRAIPALGKLIGGKGAQGQTFAATVVVVVLALCFVRLSPEFERTEFLHLPWWLEWLRPPAKCYRVVVLMPPWGAWAMLVTLKFCRPGERTEPQVRALARGCDAVAVAVMLAVLLGVSIVYFQYMGLGAQVLVPLATIAVAIASGVGFSLAGGGLSRGGLLAANITTQLALVMAYLAGR